MFNRETHKSRGFGFIIFESEDSVDLVCAEKEHSIDGKVVSGRYHQYIDDYSDLFLCVFGSLGRG